MSGRRHGKIAAESDEAVAARLAICRAGLADELDVGVGPDLVEEHGVLEVRERRIRETGRDDSLVGDEERPGDPQLGDERADACDRTGAVDDPGRHLDASDCRDFHAHGPASLSQRIGGNQRSGIFSSRPT